MVQFWRTRRTAVVTFRLLLICTLFLQGLFTPRPASACSCAVSRSPTGALAEAAAVFSGYVTRIEYAPPKGGSYSSGDPVTVTFQVDTAWKGEVRAIQQIMTVRSSDTCGYEFSGGMAFYLVYAREHNNQLHADLCSRTRPGFQAAADIAALGTGQPPQPTEIEPASIPASATVTAGLPRPSASESPESHVLLPWLAASGWLVAGVMAGAWLWQRRWGR